MLLLILKRFNFSNKISKGIGKIFIFLKKKETRGKLFHPIKVCFIKMRITKGY